MKDIIRIIAENLEDLDFDYSDDSPEFLDPPLSVLILPNDVTVLVTFSTRFNYYLYDGPKDDVRDLRYYSQILDNNYAELFDNCGDLLSLKQACDYVMQFGDKLFVTPQKTVVNRHFLPKDHWSSENRLDLSSYVKMITGDTILDPNSKVKLGQHLFNDGDQGYETMPAYSMSSSNPSLPDVLHELSCTIGPKEITYNAVTRWIYN